MICRKVRSTTGMQYRDRWNNLVTVRYEIDQLYFPPVLIGWQKCGCFLPPESGKQIVYYCPHEYAKTLWKAVNAHFRRPLHCPFTDKCLLHANKWGPYEIKGAFMGKSKSGCSNLTKILRFLGRFKNGWWIHKIHTLDGFFGSHSQNPDFWDYRFKGSIFVGAMGGEGFEKRNYDKRFSEYIWQAFYCTCMTFIYQ